MTADNPHLSNVVALPGGSPPAAALNTDDEVRLACQAELERCHLTITQAARELGRGVSQATLSRWLRGTYDGDNAAVAGRVRTWLETRRERAARSIGGAGLGAHAHLDVTDEIETVLGHAQAAGSVVMVHGPSGTGKSHAAERYCATHTAAYRLMATEVLTTLSGLLTRVSAAIGGPGQYRSALEAEADIVDRLSDRGALLIIDEAQHLSARLLDELRCIRDLSGCGLALVGDDRLWAYVSGSPHCPQIVGRISIKRSFASPSAADVAAFAERVLQRRPTAKESTLLTAEARKAGGLHTLRGLLVRAWAFARAGGRNVGLDDLQAAAEEGGVA